MSPWVGRQSGIDDIARQLHSSSEVAGSEHERVLAVQQVAALYSVALQVYHALASKECFQAAHMEQQLQHVFLFGCVDGESLRMEHLTQRAVTVGFGNDGRIVEKRTE